MIRKTSPKMRLEPTLLVLLCSLMCVSNGAPPGEVGKKLSFGAPYTAEEDQFIIDELQNILEHTLKPQSMGVWHKIAEKHYEKLEQGATGFPHERSANSLRSRFIQFLSYHKGNKTVKVPEAFIQKFKSKVSRHPYTQEEENFITEELPKSSYHTFFGKPTFRALSIEHAKKREAGIPGFENVRTASSFRNHLIVMKNTGQLPNPVLPTYHDTYEKWGAGNSQNTTSKQETGFQETNEGQCEDDWIADMIEELQDNADIEIDFSKLE